MKTNFFINKQSAYVAFFTILSAGNASAQQDYSPYADRDFPENVYWGDTHLHTNLSVDAYGMGNAKLTPDDAYRFAKGESIVAHNGQQARLRRPLDFLVVADHAVNMGVLPKLRLADPDLLNTELGKRWYEKLVAEPFDLNKALNAPTGKPLGEFRSYMSRSAGAGGSVIWNSFYRKPGDRDKAEVFLDPELRQSVWSDVVKTADRHNDPGSFTAFIGYEWTALALYQPNSSIHRVVVFKDGADKVSKVSPFSYFDSNKPEDLWAYFERYEKATGGEVLAIPHNSNASNGVMFALRDSSGKTLSQAYAKTRSKWEPLMEVTQIKGDSETHPLLSPEDEFADFDTWDTVWSATTLEGKWAEYARSALALGLQQKAKLGVNPFKFGMIGSTDSHTSLSTADEDNFWGKMSYQEPSKYRTSAELFVGDLDSPFRWNDAASGYAAVWAQENTRDSLFAAMMRKEVYATTGPRITLRFFGGWNYKKADAFAPDLAAIGYQGGVPMGGDLAVAPEGRAPKFLIRAVKDPDGANLDRVQVIKGWRSEDGELHEEVYDVALSDGRKIRVNKRSEAVGSTVDVEDASYTNTIGDSELAVVWEDPNFDANELAFYYVRVIEIPTPRWTAYDAKRFNIPRADIPDDVPMFLQERAYSSPIWYSPSNDNK